MDNWKYAVRSIDDVRERGSCSGYHILSNGRNLYNPDITEESYIEQGYTILTWDELNSYIKEHEESLLNHWSEETKEEYENALNVLPPLRWSKGGFFISEALDSNIHSFHRELDGKFYTSNQRTSTPRDQIIENLRAFIKNNK